MRLFEFDQNEVNTAGKIERLAEMIAKDCQPYLNLIHFPQRDRSGIPFLLYRGMHQNDVPADILTPATVRKDRKPLDTNKLSSEIVDDWLFNLVKWRPRSAGLFVTSITRNARDYGVPYLVFPIGPFDYLWSPVISDMMVAVNTITGPKQTPDERQEKLIKKMLAKADWQHNKGFDTFMRNTFMRDSYGTEIVLNVNSFYAVPLCDSYIRQQNLLPALERAFFNTQGGKPNAAF